MNYIFGTAAADKEAIIPFLIFTGFLIIAVLISELINYRKGQKERKEFLERRASVRRNAKEQRAIDDDYQQYLDDHKKGVDHYKSGLH